MIIVTMYLFQFGFSFSSKTLQLDQFCPFFSLDSEIPVDDSMVDLSPPGTLTLNAKSQIYP
jgi:hypothetical protein